MRGSLGEFEQLLLLALLGLGTEAYGVTLRDDIERRTGRGPSPGAIYTALDRLERRGFVRSRLGDPTPERGGKRKRYYALLPAGEQAVRASQERLRRMSHGLSPKADLP
ncbi:MAG: PadR family transcriptional regulator [Vicinamibacterales bacterium]